MAKIIVNLKNNKKKDFKYSSLKNDIIISNIKISNDFVYMDIQYKPSNDIKTYQFVLSDYCGIPVLNNMTDEQYETDIPFQSYIQEIFETLAEINNFTI